MLPFCPPVCRLLHPDAGPDEGPGIPVRSPGCRGGVHLITAVSAHRALTAANPAELPQRPPRSPVSSSLLQAAAPLLQHDPGEGSMAAALAVSRAATTAHDAKQPVHSALTG